ncbi:MAG: phosphonate ABC transporter, permease protein PhnE [Opitutales bacterium]|nr:phosphonate ABC transporter, permease protein PhnE [Opitutales bacterium]
MSKTSATALPYDHPSRKNKVLLYAIGGIILFEFLAFLFFYLKNSNNNPFRLITDFHHVLNLIPEMMPPNFHLLFGSWDLWLNMTETLSMAFLGTLFGGILAFFLCFMAAKNTAPLPFLYPLARTTLAILRVAPDYAIMLIIVIAVGFGPFAGTLAIIVGSTGMFGKFFADAVEHTEKGEIEGVSTVGADWFQSIRYGILPQVLPSFVANMCFFFEINLGAAIALGVFGGGGLGFHLNIANDSLNYRDMFAYLIVILLMRISTEWISDKGRNFIFKEGALLR